MQDERDQLSALFAAYREALPDPEPGAGFTPGLWAKIDARRRDTNRLAILARRMVLAAGAVTLATIGLVYTPIASFSSNPALTSTYVEVLSDGQDLLDADSAGEAL